MDLNFGIIYLQKIIDYFSKFSPPIPLINLQNTNLIMLLILTVVLFVVDVLLMLIIGKRKETLIKIVLFILFLGFGFVLLNYIGIFSSVDLLLSTLILYAIMVVPFGILSILTKNNEKITKVGELFIGPIYEELVYRFVLLGFLIYNGFGLNQYCLLVLFLH